jgi:hypothetical protein
MLAPVALACLVLLAGAVTQTAKPATDVTRLGPQVGQQVPDFTLADQTGTTRSLKSIIGRNGAMLVFVRSADW